MLIPVFAANNQFPGCDQPHGWGQPCVPGGSPDTSFHFGYTNGDLQPWTTESVMTYTTQYISYYSSSEEAWTPANINWPMVALVILLFVAMIGFRLGMEHKPERTERLPRVFV